MNELEEAFKRIEDHDIEVNAVFIPESVDLEKIVNDLRDLYEELVKEK